MKTANRIPSAILAAMVVATMSGYDCLLAEEAALSPVAPSEEGAAAPAPGNPLKERMLPARPTVPEEETIAVSHSTAPRRGGCFQLHPHSPWKEKMPQPLLLKCSGRGKQLPLPHSSPGAGPGSALTPAALAPKKPALPSMAALNNSIAEATLRMATARPFPSPRIFPDNVVSRKKQIHHSLDIASGITLSGNGDHNHLQQRHSDRHRFRHSGKYYREQSGFLTTLAPPPPEGLHLYR